MGTYEEIMNLLENGKLIGTKKNPEFDLMEVHYLNKKFSEWCNCFCLDKNGLIEAILESKKATEVMTNIAMAWLLALKFQFKNEYLYDKRNEYSVKQHYGIFLFQRLKNWCFLYMEIFILLKAGTWINTIGIEL